VEHIKKNGRKRVHPFGFHEVTSDLFRKEDRRRVFDGKGREVQFAVLEAKGGSA